MFENTPFPSSNSTTSLADAATRSAEQALSATRQMANGTIDGLGDAVHRLRDDTVPVIDRISAQAQALAHQGMEAVRDQSHQLQARARRTSEDTVHYIRDEPVKAVLIAAATGAALMALAGLLMRTPGRR